MRLFDVQVVRLGVAWRRGDDEKVDAAIVLADARLIPSPSPARSFRVGRLVLCHRLEV